MKKRYLSFLLCIILSLTTIQVSALSTSQEISDRLSQISKTSGYTVGSFWNSGACWKFANAVSRTLFGVAIPTSPTGQYYLTNASYNKDWDTIGTCRGGSGANQNILNLLKRARPGDLLQYRSSTTSAQHTAIVYAVSDNGMSIYDHTSGVQIRTSTWSKIFDERGLNGVGSFETGVENSGLSLYRCNKNVKSGDNPPPPKNDITITVISADVKTTGADTITETSAVLRGSFTTTGKRATECGMYLGTSPSKDALTKLGSDSVNTYGTSMFYSTSKYGKTLTPGTTYYYQAYATVNGEEKRGSIESFTTKGTAPIAPPVAPTLSVSLSSNALTLEYGTRSTLTASTTPAALPVTWKSTDESVVTVTNGMVAAVDSGTAYVIAEVFGNNDQTASAKCRVTVKEAPKSETGASGTIIYPVTVKVTTKGADNITETSATVRGNVSVNGGKATECGMYFGTSAGDLTFLGSDSINSSNMPFYYNTSKYGRTLSPDTTYYYRAYAVVNGETYWGETASFTTTKTTPTASVTVTTKGADNVTQTSATVRGNVSVNGGKATECGMYFGTSASNLTFLGSDSINSSNMPFYYGTSKYGRTLTPGTTYYYRAYAVVNGETYWGETASFTTATSAPASTGNTRTAVVVNTNGQYLAINDRPAASPRNSTQIGRIPPAGTVTVYPDKTSGNWYYVQYNGVSGYAYSKYLSLR